MATPERFDSSENISSQQEEEFEKKRHHWAEEEHVDYYEIMGLGEARWDATQDQIKKAYRRMALKYHPDKNPDIPQEVFQKFQKAYEVLSDPAKRKAYDSQEDFDDSIPSDRAYTAQEFYKIFRPVFKRNSKWSSRNNVPDIGDDNTPIEEVEAFYEFWFRFKSWRDFSCFDEFNLEEAESRYEKRWMDRQNKKDQKGRIKAEDARIRNLTVIAQQSDPRVLRKKEEIKAQQQKIKDRKEAQKLAKKREFERIEEKKKEEENKKRQEQLAQKEVEKKEKEKRNKLLRKKRSNLRQAVKKQFDTGYQPPNMDHVELLCLKLDAEGLTRVSRAFQTSPEEAQTVFEAEVEKFIPKPKVAKVKEEENVVWSEAELGILAKALQKYPPGTGNRWKLVCSMLPGKKQAAVVAKAQEAKGSLVKEVRKTGEQRNQEAFNKLKEENKEASMKVNDHGTTNYDLINAEVKEEKKEKVEEKKEKVEEKTPVEEKKEEVKEEVKEVKEEVKEEVKDEVEEEEVKEEEEGEWSADEQKLLEEGLKEFPAALGKERWDKIAEKVPNRSKKECFQRYKNIVESLKARKN